MIKSFSLQMPREIHFGAGQRDRLPGLLRGLGKRVLVFSGQHWFAGSGWRQSFLELLETFELHFIQCPGGEPEVESLNALLAQAREIHPEVIVAVGGGSVLDTAKAVSGLLPVREGAEDYLEGVGRGLSLDRPGVPWIAMPTTSGTGAEVTKNAVLKSKTLGAKKSLRSPYLLASCAVVDPELTLGAPLSLTGRAGMDALTQLVEAFVSRKAAPVPRALARQAFSPMLRALREIPRDPDNLEARSAAAYGSMASGIALANSGLGAAHGFASGLGGLHDIPHGLICALFIRPVLRANAEVIREDCGLLYRSALEQGATVETGRGDPVRWLINEISELFDLYELPQDLKGFAIDGREVPEIARRSSGSSMSGNPRELSQQEREELIAGLI